MSGRGDPTLRDEAFEAEVRNAFLATMAAAPASPDSVRATHAAIPLAGALPAVSARVRRLVPRLAALVAAGAVIIVAAVGLWSVASMPRPSGSETATATGSASAPPSASTLGFNDLFLPGQVMTGDGWRLVAGRRGVDAGPPTLVPRITLYYGDGMIKPVEALHLPPVEAIADQQTEGLLVIDFVVGGGGPICDQIRLDDVTFDLARAEVTVRYVSGQDAEPGAVAACAASASPATIVVAIARDHLPTGQIVISLVRSSPSTSDVVEGTATMIAPTLPLRPDETSPVDEAGRFGPDGLWATTGTTLRRSLDGGSTWLAVTMPVAARPFVLDADHAWIASPGPGSTDFTGDATDVLRYVVDRTSDGGRTWTRSTVPESVPGTTPVLAFSDAIHGYLLAAGFRGSLGDALFRTDDGGATWHLVPRHGSMTGYLGSMFGLGPDGSLWAGTQGDAGPVERPVLDVSRDGGRTWADARLPGLEGSHFATNTVLGPPTFFGESGVVAVMIEGGAGYRLDVFTTTDGGLQWTETPGHVDPTNGSQAFAPISARSWSTAGPGADLLEVTADGGATWQPRPATGLRGQPLFWLGFVDADHGVAIVALGDSPAPDGLVVTADGGRTWGRAAFGP